jgi:hypothetical protein
MNTQTTQQMPPLDRADAEALSHLKQQICTELMTETDPRAGIASHRFLAFACECLGVPVPPISQVAPQLDLTGVDVAAIHAELQAQENQMDEETKRAVELLVAMEKRKDAEARFGFDSSEHVAALAAVLELMTGDERQQLIDDARKLSARFVTSDSHRVQ